MTADRLLAGDRLTRGLGLASLALAGPPLLRPDSFTGALGVGVGSVQRTTATAIGIRELAAAAGLLGRPGPGWLWARVAGDAMDLAVLGRALARHDGRKRGRTIAAAAAVASVAAIDLYAARTRSRERTTLELTATTTVRKPAREVYDAWRQLDNLPTFMAHLEEVRTTGERTSHWRASAPFGRSVQWDAEITEDVAGARIGWRSVEGADIANEGTVGFSAAPGDQGTEVHVTLRYAMPGGKLGEAVARFLGEDPHQQLDDDLRRFKQVVETGEVVRSDGAPGGKRARKEFPQHPAQPLSAAELSREGIRA